MPTLSRPLVRVGALLCCLLLTHLNADTIDLNGDGMSDIYAAVYGVSDANADSDGDGVSNKDEAAWGTNPFDPESKVETLLEQGADQTFSLLIKNKSGNALTALKRYKVEVSDDLASWVSPGQLYASYPALPQPENFEGSFILNYPESLKVDLMSYHRRLSGSTGFTMIGNAFPQKMFWRVTVEDVDSDADGMSDYEQALYQANSLSTFPADADGDGVSNANDAAPFNPSVGALQVVVTYPAEGATID